MNYETFAEALKRVVNRQLPAVELMGLVQQFVLAGERALGMTLYREWLQFNKGDPAAYAIHFNYGIMLNDDGDLAGAQAQMVAALDVNPSFRSANVTLGSIYEKGGLVQPALDQWYFTAQTLAEVNNDNIAIKAMALKHIGRVLEPANALVRAEEALRQSLDILPEQRDVAQHWLTMRQRQNKWPIIEPFARMTHDRLMRSFAPLSLANYSDDPLFQLATAYQHCKHDIGRPAKVYPASDYAPRRQPKDKLRIGYVSSDLREHAVGYLTAEIYELHDRSQVEVYVYFSGLHDGGPLYNRVKGSADVWKSISGLPAEVSAEMIRADQIDILIDLNGYTKDGPLQTFAMRPAPVLVNWLGYPGTLGSPHHHYILGDDYIIPPGSEMYYTEKVMRLPCYQPNDRKRTVASSAPTRADVGLPEDAMVYCSFNGTQKITSFVFDRWMEILKAVPNSVLWLLKCGETSDQRLQLLAQQRGVDPNRLIFAERAANAEHVARYVLADLFLDTLPYGAHTTASDALWMGLPVLTLPGRGFASRVCASLVNAAGVPEFICSSPEHYVQRAVEIGLNRAQLAPAREKLIATRFTSVLFDTPALVRTLESLYRDMWSDFVNGTLPRPDLTNLDVYHEIGASLDHDKTEFACLPNYLELYQEKLADWDAYWPLPKDCRLWK